MGFSTLCNYMMELGAWSVHSFYVLLLTCGLIMASSRGNLFLHSYFAHCALVYVIAKNVVHRAQASGWFLPGLSRIPERVSSRKDWDNRKKRVVLLTVCIVHECLVLAMIPQRWLRPGKKD